MNRTTFFIASVASFGLGVGMGCPPAPSPTPPSQDAGDASFVGDAVAPANDGTLCAIACASMWNAKCPEGLDTKCVATCAHVVDAGLIRLDVKCLARATTKIDVQNCGVECR